MADATSVCLKCGIGIDSGGNPGSPRMYCSASCKARAYRENNPDFVRRQADKRRSARDARELTLPPRRKCRSCGQELPLRRPDWKYCNSEACQRVAYRERREHGPRCSEVNCGRPVTGRGLCSMHYARQWRAKNPQSSPESSARRRATQRKAFVEEVDRAKVFDRDSWKCGLCGGRIPKGAAFPDPLFGTIDHIVPLSQGGEHSMLNVQAAHFSCNSGKRDRGGGEQLALIG